MASVAFHQLDKTTHDEYACTFAALILHDEGVPITADKIKKLIEASGNKVETYWPALYAKALAGKNVGDLLAGGGAPAPTGPAAGAAPVKAVVPVKKEEKVVEKKEDEDMGGPIGLFGDDEDY